MRRQAATEAKAAHVLELASLCSPQLNAPKFCPRLIEPREAVCYRGNADPQTQCRVACHLARDDCHSQGSQKLRSKSTLLSCLAWGFTLSGKLPICNQTCPFPMAPISRNFVALRCPWPPFYFVFHKRRSWAQNVLPLFGNRWPTFLGQCQLPK
jgi:hypothetical protein